LRFTDEEIRRYSRQMIVPEVGGIGQERLRAASATATREVEALYLAAAGVGTVRVPSEAMAEAVRALNPLVRVEIGSPTATGSEEAAAKAWRTIKEVLAL
jgi:molybdopterin/thiamine biosynthesis adenylyltransferase